MSYLVRAVALNNIDEKTQKMAQATAKYEEMPDPMKMFASFVMYIKEYSQAVYDTSRYQPREPSDRHRLYQWFDCNDY
jgi:hypothetical protein